MLMQAQMQAQVRAQAAHEKKPSGPQILLQMRACHQMQIRQQLIEQQAELQQQQAQNQQRHQQMQGRLQQRQARLQQKQQQAVTTLKSQQRQRSASEQSSQRGDAAGQLSQQQQQRERNVPESAEFKVEFDDDDETETKDPVIPTGGNTSKLSAKTESVRDLAKQTKDTSKNKARSTRNSRSPQPGGLSRKVLTQRSAGQRKVAPNSAMVTKGVRDTQARRRSRVPLARSKTAVHADAEEETAFGVPEDDADFAGYASNTCFNFFHHTSLP